MKFEDAEANAVLERNECSICEGPTEQLFSIYDENGDFLVSVPRDISGRALSCLFTHGARQFDIGREWGERSAKAAFRAAIGIDA